MLSQRCNYLYVWLESCDSSWEDVRTFKQIYIESGHAMQKKFDLKSWFSIDTLCRWCWWAAVMAFLKWCTGFIFNYRAAMIFSASQWHLMWSDRTNPWEVLDSSDMFRCVLWSRRLQAGSTPWRFNIIRLGMVVAVPNTPSSPLDTAASGMRGSCKLEWVETKTLAVDTDIALSTS